MVNFKSTPYSKISKNGSPILFLSFEEPIEPMADISKVSAPLKIFLIKRLGLSEKPIDWILLCDTSVLKPKLNFFRGVKLTMVLRVLSGFSIYSILGYLKFLNSFIYL